jgi:hypothetical protein
VALRVGRQGERVLRDAQDVDPLEHGLGDRPTTDHVGLGPQPRKLLEVGPRLAGRGDRRGRGGRARFLGVEPAEGGLETGQVAVAGEAQGSRFALPGHTGGNERGRWRDFGRGGQGHHLGLEGGGRGNVGEREANGGLVELGWVAVALDPGVMGPREAAMAIELRGVRHVMPVHYRTFPILAGRPDALRRELADRGVDRVTVYSPEPGGLVS